MGLTRCLRSNRCLTNICYVSRRVEYLNSPAPKIQNASEFGHLIRITTILNEIEECNTEGTHFTSSHVKISSPIFTSSIVPDAAFLSTCEEKLKVCFFLMSWGRTHLFIASFGRPVCRSISNIRKKISNFNCLYGKRAPIQRPGVTASYTSCTPAAFWH